ncbi:ABC transporter permease [Paracoccus aminophilus]|uniref:ABC ferric siderophore transporter, inner membrane subunit n=1 Tax=Paracoccus aminophilus JCM 7686 TaxID=1367847 RepID=S5Y1L2_PARAH|nr:iron chelate uptake ABC transporter family permease subunit [Paracoccus aminophilus]AGT11377.1 ABC ferric siderophore transporter, inner membrane subunit [Paracoccus aminophilus JCM 7686]
MRLLSALLILLAGLMLISLMIGAASFDLWRAGSDPWATMLLLESRVPRTLSVVLTGAALAVAGMVMQQLVRNKFVGPSSTGTAESAALGLLLITIWAPGAPIWVKMVVASLAAMAGTALFMTVIRRLPVREVMLVPIAGMVLAGVIGSVVTFIAWQTDLMQYISTWLMTGEFSGVVAGRYEMLWFAGAAAAASWFAADRFAILGLGEGVARGLGLDPKPVMRLGLVVVSVVTAMVVVTVGMVPFVGLVVPNIVSRIMGDDLKSSLPVVAAAGAVLVLACDILGRVLRYPYEIPVGTVLGVLGSVIFLILLYRPPRHV